jgi:hypothetical protein
MKDILTDRKPLTAEVNPACAEITEKSPVDVG